MFRAFNMGIGLVIVCASGDADQVIALAAGAGERGAFRLGVVTAGDRQVRYL